MLSPAVESSGWRSEANLPGVGEARVVGTPFGTLGGGSLLDLLDETESTCQEEIADLKRALERDLRQRGACSRIHQAN